MWTKHTNIRPHNLKLKQKLIFWPILYDSIVFAMFTYAGSVFETKHNLT